MKQTITKKWLEKREACQIGIDKFVKLKEKRVDALVKMALRSRSKMNADYLEWAEWLIEAAFNKKEYKKYYDYSFDDTNMTYERKVTKNLRYGLKLGAKK